MATAYHMVHYRRVEGKNDSSLPTTMEVSCRNVLDAMDATSLKLWERIQDRVFNDPDGMKQQVILNRVADLHSAIFGELCLVDSHGFQAVLEQVKSKVTLSDLTTAEIFALAEKEAPAGTQFLRGIAYWLVIANHLFFVKTQSMSPRLLQKYFEWLLKGKADSWPSSVEIVLQAEFDKTKIAGDLGDIRNLRVKGGASPEYAVTPITPTTKETVVSTAKKVGDRFVQFTQAIPIVEALLGPTKTNSLMESMGPEEYFAVEASVKIRGKRTQASKDALKQLTNELADITDGSVQIEGKNGKLSDGDAILRMTMPFQIQEGGTSLLEFDNVADQLQEVYKRFVADGVIGA